MARISILLTDTMIQALERIQRVQPLAARAGVMSSALEAGLISLANGTATPAVTSRRKRSPPKEPAERFDQTLDACDRGVVDAHDMTTSEPEVTAMTAVTGSADADEQEAYFEGLSSSPGGIAANPFE